MERISFPADRVDCRVKSPLAVAAAVAGVPILGRVDGAPWVPGTTVIFGIVLAAATAAVAEVGAAAVVGVVATAGALVVRTVEIESVDAAGADLVAILVAHMAGTDVVAFGVMHRTVAVAAELEAFLAPVTFAAAAAASAVVVSAAAV